MKLASRIVLVCAVTLGCYSSLRAQVLSPEGYGVVRFGMSLTLLEAKLGEKALPKNRESDCSFVRFKKYPRIEFMIEDGIVTRADAGHRIKNSAGVTIGMSTERVKRMYPEVQIEPHQYDDTGHYLVLATPDKRAALLFEAANGKVTKFFRAGLQPAVSYVERCL